MIEQSITVVICDREYKIPISNIKKDAKFVFPHGCTVNFGVLDITGDDEHFHEAKKIENITALT